MSSFNSWSAIEQALKGKATEALQEVITDSLKDLHMNVHNFYSSPEGRYQRQGHLSAAPEAFMIDDLSGEVRLNTDYTYIPSGRSTSQIYEYAENGGLLGRGGFWKNTMDDIPRHIHKSFSKRFYD